MENLNEKLEKAKTISATNMTDDVYKKILSLIDLTSLNNTDTESKIIDLVQKVNSFSVSYPH
ncbi:MAG: hypothetical protein AB7D08_07290, partial [Bacteroidales bacterium]